jgi:dihydrofolate reductase
LIRKYPSRNSLSKQTTISLEETATRYNHNADSDKITSTSKGTIMRKVIAGLFISLDGVTESPDQWQFDHFDEDMMAALEAHIEAEDTILLGRVTYEEWAPFWPTSTDEPYASHINKVPKFVVSTTLDEVEWGKWDNVTLIKDNLAEEIARLKRQDGKNIGVSGSPTLVQSLLQADLLDELTLMVHPVIVGRGKRLFKDESDLKRVKLVDSQTTRTGVMLLTYQPL